MNLKVKKLHPQAVLPKIMRPGDAGADLTAVSVDENDLYVEYGTGLAVAIPQGYVGLLFPRSSCSNYHLVLANCVGVIDSNYRGEIKLRFKKTCDKFWAKTYEIGDRVGQLIVMPIPEVNFEEVEDLDETVRGDLGFGSSDNEV